MNLPPDPARIHLLPAKSAPVVAIVRRKPSKLFHVIKWNTRKNTFEQGSWFKGKLYPMRCDVSPNGEWMVYLAMGDSGETWNGVCRLPWLKTEAEGENMGSWFGGGYWDSSGKLKLNKWTMKPASLPFPVETIDPTYGSEDEGVLFPRMLRDGWIRAGDNWGEHREIKDASRYQVECRGDDGWIFKPSRRHPTLRTKYLGYFEKGRTFRFSIDEYPEVLDDEVDWAAWDCGGDLVYAKLGSVYMYNLADLAKGEPTFFKDLEILTHEST
jgi:hypothetical protein